MIGSIWEWLGSLTSLQRMGIGFAIGIMLHPLIKYTPRILRWLREIIIDDYIAGVCREQTYPLERVEQTDKFGYSYTHGHTWAAFAKHSDEILAIKHQIDKILADTLKAQGRPDADPNVES